MTRDQARRLREAWAMKKQECTHETIILETTDNGYLTGNRLSQTCGAEMEARPKKES